MRIVIATFGSLGDIHPMMALGLELQSRGHAVAIVTSEFYRQKIAAAGLGFHPARPDLRPDDKALVRASMDERRGPETIVRYMMGELRGMYADFERAACADGGADLLITSDLAYAGPILAEKIGLRWCSQVLSPIGFFSAYDPTVLPPVPWLSKLSALGPSVYGAILGLIKSQALKAATPINEFRRELGLAPVKDPFFTDKNSPELVLAMFSPLIAHRQPDWPARTLITGYAWYDRHRTDEGSRPDEPAPALSALRAFLDAGDAPIVFTLGSVAVFDPGAFYRESVRTAQRLGRRAVLLVGPDPDDPPPPSRDIGVFDYAPFSQLFPRAAAIVHQGGSGTTAQAMRAGRPMLIVPYSHDQPDNALRVKRLGISDTIRRGRYRAERAAPALERLLTDPAVAARAAAIGHEVSREDGARVAADAIDAGFRL
ncbi:MAG TPA: glycosyltransferase [Vicinamibacterales bacterium]|nr:glycosyltransferase [Vicinamibacterales bacterium]